MVSLLELRLRMFKADLIIAKRNLHYKLSVTKDRHQRAVEETERFAGDLMAYINEPKVIGKLGLGRLQRRTASTIVEDTKESNMMYSGLKTQHDGFPKLELPYRNYEGIPDLSNPPEGIFAIFCPGYNIDSSLPVSAWFGGMDFYSDEKISYDVYFLFSPEIVTLDNISNIINKSDLANTKINTTENRITLEHRRPRLGIEETRKYHLLGEMEWSGPTLQVYAYNGRSLKTTECRRVSEGELSFALD